MNKNDARNSLKQALVDVRSAYRLLYAYHKRIRGIIEIIEGGLGEELKFWEWSPKRWNKPSRKLTSNNWTWDCFPFHSYSIWYSQTGGNEKPKKGDILLHLVIDTDSGFPDIMSSDVDPIDSKNFVSVSCDGSISKLTVNLVRCEIDGNEKTWDSEDYDSDDWLNYPILQSHGFNLYTKMFDLCTLYDAKQVHKELDPLVNIINHKQNCTYDEIAAALRKFFVI